jgi:hypothetical protein
MGCFDAYGGPCRFLLAEITVAKEAIRRKAYLLTVISIDHIEVEPPHPS